jgi:hypothetical protein
MAMCNRLTFYPSERFGRQEREKLARMEAAMEEHERKLKEEQEKMDKLDQIHKVLPITD